VEASQVRQQAESTSARGHAALPQDLSRRLQDANDAMREQSERWEEQLRNLAQRQVEDLACTEDQLQGLARQGQASAVALRGEIAAAAGEVREACRRLVREEMRTQEASITKLALVHRQASATSMAEPRVDVQEFRALRDALASQEAEADARWEQAKQFKQDLGKFSATMEQHMTDMNTGAKLEVQEQWRHQGRQLVVQQLDERLQPLCGRVAEAVEEAQAARRAEAELGRRCERLQQACVELTVGQEVLTQHATSATKDLTWLQAEVRARLQGDARPAGEPWPETARSRENSRECRGGDRLRCAWSGCLETGASTDSSLGRLTARLMAQCQEQAEAPEAPAFETQGGGAGGLGRIPTR